MGTKNKQLRVGWKVSSLSNNMASVRYRALLPILALKELNVVSTVFSDANPDNLNSIDILVIVKSFTSHDLLLAQEAENAGIPIVIDLCDNLFIESYGQQSGKTSPKEVFKLIAKKISAVVTTTQPLADVLTLYVEANTPIFIVPDGIETDELIKQGEELLLEARKRQNLSLSRLFAKRMLSYARKLQIFKTASLKKLINKIYKKSKRIFELKFWLKKAYYIYDFCRSKLTCTPRRLAKASSQSSIDASIRSYPVAQPDAKIILWFGNHGAPHARFGMLDLLEIRNALETIATETPIELVVISNNLEKFEQYIRPFSLPTRYLAWSVDIVEKYLQMASVVVIPNSLDEFSICKSANRTVLSLSFGVPVVATATPALDCLSSAIVTNDFASGLRRYLFYPDLAKDDVLRGKELIQLHFGQKKIGSLWSEVINYSLTKKPDLRLSKALDLVIVLNLIQDLDLALPIIKRCREKNIQFEVWCSTTLLQKSPRVMATLDDIKAPHRIILDDSANMPKLSFPKSLKALITVAETNLGPHRFTRSITEQANQRGIVTATMQHGYENVGLTYTDEIHSIDKINFSSNKIYIWGDKASLNAHIPISTLNKCYTTGSTKQLKKYEGVLKKLLPNTDKIIGVFENLHWHRYSEEYRQFFLDSVIALANKFPEITFLIKPHHAGIWLTGRYKGDRPNLDNLFVIDPQNPMWEPYTATDLIGGVMAVITTPSTVALDAAMAMLPVAVVDYDLGLNNYKALTKIKDVDDWINFVQEANEKVGRSRLLTLSEKFVNESVVSGDAVDRILTDLSIIN